MPDYLGNDMRKTKDGEEKEDKEIKGRIDLIWLKTQILFSHVLT